jgi:hypothetical protein
MSNRKLRVGTIAYLKNVGYPYDRTDDGSDSWEGASCVVTQLNAGACGKMVEVRLFMPIRTTHGRFMDGSLFDGSIVIPEDRPWLKKHLKNLLDFDKQLEAVRQIMFEIKECRPGLRHKKKPSKW